MRFNIVILAVFVSFLGAEVKSFSEIKNEPKSLAKDYYIYRILDETKYNKSELKGIRSQIYRLKGKLKAKINAIFPYKPAPAKTPCSSVGLKNILDANVTCQNALMYGGFVTKLTPELRANLAQKLKNFPNSVNFLQGFNSQNPAQYFADTNNAKNFMKYYKFVGEKSEKINVSFDMDFANSLANEDSFKKLLEYAIINKKFTNLRQSMLQATTSSPENGFLLGINAITFGKTQTAANFFDIARKNGKKAGDVNAANFWYYLCTKDEDALKTLAQSTFYDTYTLFAKEKIGNKNIDIIIPTPIKEMPQNYDITDPFTWVRTKNKVDKFSKNGNIAELRKMADFFDTKATIGEYSYIMNKINGYKDNFYPTPFMEHIGDGDNHRKALILALARQESRFVPSVVSISYALGMMQFMPFVANDIGKKQLKIPGFDQDDMFKPEVAYQFANIHLDWLEQKLTSPVFIAYAYNGGLGFTTKMLQRNDMFKHGEFEPFLSMELVPFAESRDYAKKVLANYIIYRQILEPNAKVSIISELEKLLDPDYSDKIRK